MDGLGTGLLATGILATALPRSKKGAKQGSLEDEGHEKHDGPSEGA